MGKKRITKAKQPFSETIIKSTRDLVLWVLGVSAILDFISKAIGHFIPQVKETIDMTAWLIGFCIMIGGLITWGIFLVVYYTNRKKTGDNIRYVSADDKVNERLSNLEDELKKLKDGKAH